jgi:Holliday junction resolvase RusA-like endonuclease
MIFLEFTVEGPPVSHQTNNRPKLQAWMQVVKAAAAARWTGAPLTVPLRLTVAYYHEGPAIRIDNDNMVKPIQDALNQFVYQDDKQITDTVVRKTNIDEPFAVRGASMVLLEAFSRGKEFLHITIGPAPSHATPLT